MKFKINYCRETKHKNILSCLDWATNDEIYTIGDEQQLFKWNAKTRLPTQVAKLPDDFYPTDLQWLCSTRPSTKSTGSGNNNSNKANDSLLISSNDGRFIMLNRNARTERIINAHVGPINACRWSNDGTGLLSAGEDGIIKIWSKSGMLRSTIIQNESPIRIACWSSNSSAIAYCSGSFIAIKPIAANSKLIKWKAHDGSVLCLSWSTETQNLASGGDDCRYKIWDSQGSLIYASFAGDYSITSIEFCPKGLFLAVGGFKMLRLCHFNGWSYSNSKFSGPTVGSIYSIRWSEDGTQVSAGTGNGMLFFAHIIKQAKTSGNLRARTTGRKLIELEDIVGRTNDILDFPDRIVKWEIGYGHLVVATTNQVHVYNEKYTNTPLSIIDSRVDVKVLFLSKKYILVLDSTSISIFTYSGRLHLTPKYSGLSAQLTMLGEKSLSLGQHFLTIRDCADESCTQVLSVMWASESNILVGLHDTCYIIWYCPGEASIDPTVIALTTMTSDITELGKKIVLENFEDSIVTFKCTSTLYPIQVNLLCETLHKMLNDDLWAKALTLCRRTQDPILWATLAAISSKKNQLEIAEEAYSASLQIDKVKYLQHIKSMPANSYEQMAETSVMMGRSNEAETILLHNNKLSEAIGLCVRMHRWERALDIALSQANSDLKRVLSERGKYLKKINRNEYLDIFLKHSN